MLVAVNRLMRAEGIAGPDLLGSLDLVALATVADVAPLTGLNRALVRQGLKVMAQRGRPGLVALAGVAGVSGPPSAWSLGFALGPRVNAGGRIGAANLGARLLATGDHHEAAALAERLNRLNAERKDIEAGVLAAARRRRRRAAPTGRWSGRRRPAGIPASSASSRRGSRRPSAGRRWSSASTAPRARARGVRSLASISAPRWHGWCARG